MRLLQLGLCLLLPALPLAGVLPAQGAFVNYEDPQIKPVTIAVLGAAAAEQRYALICNTPDNSVEIYSTTAPFPFLGRIPVGQSPVTVRWNSGNDRFYTCNYLGDSVSCVRLALDAGSVGGVRATLERTAFVGDQPTDIVFAQNNTEAIVSLDGRSGVAHLNLFDLSIITPLVLLDVKNAQGPEITHVAKAPRVMALTSDDRFYALNHLGGDIDSAPIFDMGLYVFDPNNPPPGTTGNFHSVPDIGSMNLNFAIDSSERTMFVVSQIAQNEAVGVDAVAMQKTGFVQTWLKVVQLVNTPAGSPPTVMPEAVAGIGTAWQSINLNRDYSQPGLAQVPRAEAIAQVTDVAILEGPTGVQRVALAAFGSDKVVILRRDASKPNGYAALHVALAVANPTGNYGAVGPRGLAIDRAGLDPAALHQRGLIWVCNRLDHSFAVINPWNGNVVAHRPLNSDPTPNEIRVGRPFLYSAWMTSGSGMVSCSSCHVDARTDALIWNLGNQDGPGPAIPAHFHDGDGHDLSTMPDFPNAKGLMVTQTLQGLLNALVEPYSMRSVASNAPYHWRGDKFDFPDFNEAFVRLQGMPDEPTIPDPSGLDAAEMEAYHRFINTIHHPPNPEQRKDRKLAGTLGNPDDLDDGSGGKLGMKLFHIKSVVGARSCQNCHHLPDGSSNTLTLTEKISGGFGSEPQDHPIETAATRNLFTREIVLPNGFDETDLSDFLTNPLRVNGPYGLLHAGIFTIGVNPSLTINDFVHRTFKFSNNTAKDKVRKLAVTEFVRQFDSGTAPLIGSAWTVDPSALGVANSVFHLFESDAREGNSGIAVFTRNGGVERGYWFDPRDSRYYEEGATGWLDRAGLLALASPTGADNVVIAQATPTGSERRVASLSGVPTVLTGPAPVAASIELLPMAPQTFWVDVASLSGNWDPNHPTLPFSWNTTTSGPEPVSMKSIRELQTTVAGLFGMPANPLRHEPPRRLRVIGDNIRPGARLGIGMARQSPGTWPAQDVWFDLTPTSYTQGGKTVWETAEELDPMHTMAWLNGGYWAPGVAKVMLADYTGIAMLDPNAWNLYSVAVLNEDNTLGLAPTWQPLRVQDGR